MNASQLFRTAPVILLWLCSCATQRLPSETAFNREAGRGDFLYVTLRMKGAEHALFVVDTGEPFTIIDKSLGPTLGRCVYTNFNRYEWHPSTEARIYRAPGLFLGDTRLITGNWIHTDDLGHLAPGRRISGILGMDCLRNYCIQLNFTEAKMRFLDPADLEITNLGAPFPLTLSGTMNDENSRAYVNQTLAGDKGTNSWIDTGSPNDGYLAARFFEQELTNQKRTETNSFKGLSGETMTFAKFPTGVFGGETYTNLNIGKNSHANIIGLKFLARHLVTLNFPERVMYLKKISDGPLDDEGLSAASDFLRCLRKAGRLPGWLKTVEGHANLESHPDSETFCFTAWKEGDSSVYHYMVTRTSKDSDSPWKLLKAWRSDRNYKTIEEFPLPLRQASRF